MNDSLEPVATHKKSKPKKGSFAKVITVCVIIGALVGVGFIAHSFISKYNDTQTLITYGGFAQSEANYDPHLAKFISESDEVLEKINANNEIVAVFEQPYLSGKTAVNKVTPDMKAKYSFTSKVYFNTAENVNAAKLDYVSYYESKGYVQVDQEKGNPVILLSREFNPKLEKSEAVGDDNSTTKAEDKLMITVKSSDSIHSLSIMTAQTPFIPLSALPVLDGNKNIDQIDKMSSDAKLNKVDGCDLTPNAIFGGWRDAYGCVDSEDFL